MPGPGGNSTMRADSGFYTHAVVAVCRRMDVRFSITIRQHNSLHNLIEAIPEDADADSLLAGAADVKPPTPPSRVSRCRAGAARIV